AGAKPPGESQHAACGAPRSRDPAGSPIVPPSGRSARPSSRRSCPRPRACAKPGAPKLPNRRRDGSPGRRERQVKTADGELLEVPAGWELLPPGDAALSRRVKSEGPAWSVKEK